MTEPTQKALCDDKRVWKSACFGNYQNALAITTMFKGALKLLWPKNSSALWSLSQKYHTFVFWINLGCSLIINRFNLHLNKNIDCKQSLFCSESSEKNAKSECNLRVCRSQLADCARFFRVTDSRAKERHGSYVEVNLTTFQ